MPRTLRRWSFLKKSPRHLGDDPGRPPERYPHRTMVAGRGARGPEEQDRAPLGQTGHPAPRPARSADKLGLHLWGDLPATGQGRSLGPAPMRHAGHEPAPGGSRTGRGSRSPWGHADGPGRMAPRQGPRRARQPHAGAAAGPSARIEPGREHFLRDNWLSSRVFGSYADIVDHCCSAWNRLIDQPWIIMSIGLRDWANASNA